MAMVMGPGFTTAIAMGLIMAMGLTIPKEKSIAMSLNWPKGLTVPKDKSMAMGLSLAMARYINLATAMSLYESKRLTPWPWPWVIVWQRPWV